MGTSPRDPLARLRAGWQPGERDIADADVVEQWQLLWRGDGPYLLQGHVDGQPCLAGLIAFDPVDSWALVHDRLLVLGERTPQACVAVTPEEVLRRATGTHDTDARLTALHAYTLALAAEAREAGLDNTAQLLEMAALELDRARKK
jgi:hypothetical protein